MGFKRTLSPTFRADVEANVPNADGGYDKNTFVAIFKRATTEELEVLRPKGNMAVIKEQLVGWDMQDEETKETVPYTPETLAAALLIAPTPMAIALAFWETANGARAKN